jgi:hypothetical protein
MSEPGWEVPVSARQSWQPAGDDDLLDLVAQVLGPPPLSRLAVAAAGRTAWNLRGVSPGLWDQCRLRARLSAGYPAEQRRLPRTP